MGWDSETWVGERESEMARARSSLKGEDLPGVVQPHIKLQYNCVSSADSHRPLVSMQQTTIKNFCFERSK